MGSKMSRASFEAMIQENLEWLAKQPDTLEAHHIRSILKESAALYYDGQTRREPPGPPDYPTVRFHQDGGVVWTHCPECGPDIFVDEDGCCRGCGRDAIHYGNMAGSSLGELAPSVREEGDDG